MPTDVDGLKNLVAGAVKDAAGNVLRKVTGSDEVPPELSVEPVFVSDKPWNSPQWSENLVITCADSRYIPYYDQFLDQDLKITSFHSIAVPGGIQWLALPEFLPKHNKVLRSAIEYLQRAKNVKRVICFAHEGCGAYNDSQVLGTIAHLATGKSVIQHQLDQMRQVAENLKDNLGLPVELYYASVVDNKVVFHKVE